MKLNKYHKSTSPNTDRARVYLQLHCLVEFDGLMGTFPLELLENLRPGTLEPLFNEINAKNRRARKANLIGSVVVLAMGASIILFVIYALVFG